MPLALRRACLLWLFASCFPLSQAVAESPLRVAVISDLNGSYGSTDYTTSVDRAIDRIVALRPNLVISAGDMVAGQRIPHLGAAEVAAMWAAFHAHVSDRLAAAGIPFAVTPGNHDASAYHGFERERETYGEQWRARKPALNFVDDSAYPFHYAFEAGNVLFISLDVTTTGKLPAAQKQWLARLLQDNGSKYRQRIAFSHVPLWPFARGRETEYSGDVELERLLREGGVTLYLSGHHQAFYPGHKDGVHLVGLSCLGSGPRTLLGTTARSQRTFVLLQVEGERTALAALQAPAYEMVVDWRQLPASIDTPAARLLRADLVSAPLQQLDAGHPSGLVVAGPESE